MNCPRCRTEFTESTTWNSRGEPVPSIYWARVLAICEHCQTVLARWGPFLTIATEGDIAKAKAPIRRMVAAAMQGIFPDSEVAS